MHELSIAESILNAVSAEVALHPGTRATRVGVKIGSMAAVDADSLQFCFDSIVTGSDWEPLTLVTTIIPAERLCLGCSHQFVVEHFQPDCPACGSANTQSLGGDELDLEFLDITDPEPGAAELNNLELDR
jgi:hydrogenase nickel incorporation protein HypA/HybF